jgi:hypothetical protein
VVFAGNQLHAALFPDSLQQVAPSEDMMVLGKAVARLPLLLFGQRMVVWALWILTAHCPVSGQPAASSTLRRHDGFGEGDCPPSPSSIRTTNGAWALWILTAHFPVSGHTAASSTLRRHDGFGEGGCPPSPSSMPRVVSALAPERGDPGRALRSPPPRPAAATGSPSARQAHGPGMRAIEPQSGNGSHNS